MKSAGTNSKQPDDVNSDGSIPPPLASTGRSKGRKVGAFIIGLHMEKLPTEAEYNAALDTVSPDTRRTIARYVMSLRAAPDLVDVVASAVLEKPLMRMAMRGQLPDLVGCTSSCRALHKVGAVCCHGVPARSVSLMTDGATELEELGQLRLLPNSNCPSPECEKWGCDSVSEPVHLGMFSVDDVDVDLVDDRSVLEIVDDEATADTEENTVPGCGCAACIEWGCFGSPKCVWPE